MEKTINRIYPGLTMFVRDINLPTHIAAKYTEGLIIREKAFTDASCRIMGMATTHRFAILSNHMANLREYEHDTNWGLCVAQKDSHFKVLGQYSQDGKTLILLLHLPDDETWKLFQNVVINTDKDLVVSCIERFKNKCNKAVIPELATEAWLERCTFPIGMDDNGNLFELE
jgi:hypothetical protein